MIDISFDRLFLIILKSFRGKKMYYSALVLFEHITPQNSYALMDQADQFPVYSNTSVNPRKQSFGEIYQHNSKSK